MDRVEAWARQPTSVAGFATIFGTLSAILTHELSFLQAVPILAGAIMSIALPDDSVAVPGPRTTAGIVHEKATSVARKEGPNS